jgi:MFS family permease
MHRTLTCTTSYAVDSLILLIQSIIATYAGYEFQPSLANGLTIAAYTGMLIGALFWGLGADVIGRKHAFNYSLLISSIFTIVAGASPNWIVLGLFVCLSAFGAGGNLVLDTAVFLEYLPSKHQWLLTLMAAWWGVGQLIAGLVRIHACTASYPAMLTERISSHGRSCPTSRALDRSLRQARLATGKRIPAGAMFGLRVERWSSPCPSLG